MNWEILGKNTIMKYLHTMVRIRDLEESLKFYTQVIGLKELRRMENEKWKFTLVFLATQEWEPELELTYNWWSEEVYETGRSWWHLAYRVKDIYGFCENAMKHGVEINRPPRDGHMAFIKSPDDVSIEILQEWDALEIKSPWKDMENIGTW